MAIRIYSNYNNFNELEILYLNGEYQEGMSKIEELKRKTEDKNELIYLELMQLQMQIFNLSYTELYQSYTALHTKIEKLHDVALLKHSFFSRMELELIYFNDEQLGTLITQMQEVFTQYPEILTPFNKAYFNIYKTYNCFFLRDYENYNILIEENFAINKSLNNQFFLAVTTYQKGTYYYYASDFDKALNCFLQALDIAKKIKFPSAQIMITYLISSIYEEIGDIRKSKFFLEKSKELNRKINHKTVSIFNLFQDATIKRYEGSFQESLELYRLALEKRKKFPNSSVFIFIYHNLIDLLVDQEEIEEANSILLEYNDFIKSSRYDPLYSESYSLVQAKLFSKSKRFTEKGKAVLEFESYLNSNRRQSYFMPYVIKNLIDLYFEEIMFFNNVDNIIKLKNLVIMIEEICKKMRLGVLLIQSMFLKSKLALLNNNGKEAKEILVEAEELIEEKKLYEFKDKISLELVLTDIYDAYLNMPESYSMTLKEKVKLLDFEKNIYKLINYNSKIRSNQEEKMRVNLGNKVKSDLLDIKREMRQIGELNRFVENINRRYTDSSKEEIINAINHEIRNPLNILLASVNLLNSDNSGSEADLSHGSIDSDGSKTILKNKIENQVNDLKILLNKFSNVSKLYSGDYSLDINSNPFTIDELVSLIQTQINEIQSRKRKINFRIIFDSKLKKSTLIGDITLIATVINEIIENSFKFSDLGEILVNFKVDSKKPNMLLISIKDEGSGVHTTLITDNTRDQRKGLGLGINLASKLIKIMDGTFNISSEIDKGTEILMCLPIIKEPKREKSKIKNKVSNFVLIVDDLEDNREIMGLLIKKLGFIPHFAMNGEEAFEKRIENDYTLIIMDFRMPEMDGITATKNIRKWEKINDVSEVPIVGLTAIANQKELNEGLMSGMNNYYLKPINKSKLEKILNMFS